MGQPAGFDPATLFRIETENVAFNIYSALTTYDAQSGAIADLAEKWDSADAKTWTFSLRRGVKWHGGFGELTSADVLYPSTGSSTRPLDRPIEVSSPTSRV